VTCAVLRRRATHHRLLLRVTEPRLVQLHDLSAVYSYGVRCEGSHAPRQQRRTHAERRGCHTRRDAVVTRGETRLSRRRAPHLLSAFVARISFTVDCNCSDTRLNSACTAQRDVITVASPP
jgi:hypothetical protein